jgi:hypothetical protein
MSYTYPTNWATMTKREKEKFAQTSISLEMVETAQEYVHDLFGKFSKTKTGSAWGSVMKKTYERDLGELLRMELVHEP